MTQRVRYMERQVLTADALNQEQAYRIDAHRRHNLANHDWGILRGLYVYEEDQQLWLAQGMAVDGYGRELFLSERFPIFEELFTQLYPGLTENEEAVLDLWLRYAREERPASHRGMDDRNPQGKTRSQEEARLCATRPPKDAQGNLISINPRRPSGVPPDDLDFPPFNEPPDNPARSWPVYLGRLRWVKGNSPPTRDGRARLPYAVLVGAALHSASRQPAPEDPKALTRPEPVHRARVEMASVFSGRPPFSISCSDPSGKLVQRLDVRSSGNIHIDGHTTVASVLTQEERMRMEPGEDEQGKLSILRLKSRDRGFTESMIANPRRLATRIMAGALPLRSEVQTQINDFLRHEFQRPLDTPEQRKNLRQNLAGLLNSIAEEESLATPSRLRDRRLSQTTWGLIRAASDETGSVPSNNTRIIADLLAGDMPAQAMTDSAYAMEITPLAIAETTKAMPWSVYHIRKQEEGGLTKSALRIESLDPGDKGDPSLYQFAIGKFDPEQEAFIPCLSVDAACTVTIRGRLIVDGEVIQSPVKADPSDPRFTDQLVQGWNQAEAAALTARIESITAIGNSSQWSYTLIVENKSKSTISNVNVLDTFSIRGITSPTTPMAQIASLAPAASASQIITHNSSLPGSGTLYIIVSVQGRLPNGTTIYATAKGQTTIASPLI